MKRIIFVLLVGLLLVAERVSAQTPPYSGPPILQPATGLTQPYTIGTVTVGGFQAIVQAGSLTLTDNQYSCGAPQFAACNIVYWNSTSPSTLSVTSTPSVAFAVGNAALWYVTTVGGLVTNVVAWSQVPDVPPGIAVSTSGFRLPLCNALLKQGCQASSGSLSGY